MKEKIFSKKTDKEILDIDFYDLCGSSSVFMSDEDKIKYWRNLEKLNNIKIVNESNAI